MNNFINTGILKYSEINSQKEPILLKELNRETHLKILNPRMLSGAFQGRLISLISKLIKPKKVLEIGTYTGYSALCIYEGLDKKGIIHTIDKNEELVEIQKKYFKKTGEREKFIQHTGNALEIIPEINETFDLIFLDADKENYINYFNCIIDKLNKNGVILADNVLWSGKVNDERQQDETTKILRLFNELVNNDNRVETILLPIRDGISIIRKI
ncbi:O-methyltransferase [Flavobacteriaceae bacterium]|jgi:caffeoyl-CoA O-methyltransferase|nr:O-methyltransferase [Flavobacteriaceae bacterium]MDA7716768.1 O-methyltransferase [Flavobacteriaceae bacterium]MDB4023710.1 O-methyltransferase [Flavobacteriaceae bacterium]MDB4050067.1 O-methyltransferase [Flavobacteriaceae bacterium]MDB4060001.1 O-methyltransferase [Flavobacteriaceae bacterium]